MEYKDLFFDQTFSIEFNYIGKILGLSTMNKYLTRFEIRDYTGIPCGKLSGKIVPHIKYASYMGLVRYSINEGKYLVKLTKLGEFIKEQDEFFTEKVSRLIAYYNLSSLNYGSDFWRIIIVEILFKYRENISTAVVEAEIENLTDRTIRLTGFKGCFINGGAFDLLDIIDVSEGYRLNQIKYTEKNEFAIGYTLVNELIKFDRKRSEYTLDEVTEIIKWGRSFGWSKSEVQRNIERLADKNIVALNRQLNPVIVKLKMNLSSLKEKIFDRIY